MDISTVPAGFQGSAAETRPVPPVRIDRTLSDGDAYCTQGLQHRVAAEESRKDVGSGGWWMSWVKSFFSVLFLQHRATFSTLICEQSINCMQACTRPLFVDYSQGLL